MLAFTEATDTPNIHVFDNAAFSDDEEEDKEEMATVNVSWGSPRPSFFDSMESDSGKENRSPDAFSSVAYSWRPQKPLKPQSGTTVEKPLKSILKNGVSSAAKNTSESDRISAGIEDIENQIRRLTGKLAELRLQQAAAAEAEGQAQGKQHAECEKNKGEKEKKREVEVMVGDSCNLQTAACVKQPVRRGRIVAAKFMTGVASLHKKMVELQEPPTRFQQDRRKSCFTRLPLEEQKEMRKVSRSLSLSPRKPAPRIFKISGFPTVGAKVPVRKADVTTLAKPKALFPDNVAGSGRRDYSGKVPDQPIASLQSRRKSCYYKLPKESVEKAKGPRSSSLSPKKPRPSVSKTPGFLTVGSKQPVKRDGLTNLTQPKTLFPDNVAGIGRRDYSGKVPDQPIASLQIRRKSCYYKLPKEGIEKAKGPRSSSLSPKKPRPSISKTPGFLTVGSKKPVKRDGVINLTQPKTLFQGEEAGGGRKPVAGNMKSSRVVGSRQTVVAGKQKGSS
ncbi:uncharacterized protein LOC116250454 isoform X3 [Nymphaea colorata]|uniref:uncharacterized protein LOC116250454 isoform X3 n=1 Tax=Nymphaea colorata TaxID=210225 RepID=UPI00129D598A|nr:uncharacterized protein LOC116250454 isoform X3 [Nymphaea colorata]